MTMSSWCLWQIRCVSRANEILRGELLTTEDLVSGYHFWSYLCRWDLYRRQSGIFA